MTGADSVSGPIAASGARLQIDLATAEICRTLESQSIQAILLKGPSIARLLYKDAKRHYGDCDLLVSDDTLDAAHGVLRGLGFSQRLEYPTGTIQGDRPTYAFAWRRESDGVLVEIHRHLIGVRVPPTQMWEALSARTESLVVGGEAVETLSVPARVMHIALHAAQHGAGEQQPLEDLRRAATQMDLSIWKEAFRLASRLRAEDAFRAGLGLNPEGRDLARRLGISTAPTMEVLLHSTDARPSSRAIEWFRSLPNNRERVKYLVGKIAPSPAHMRVWSRTARKGRLGLLFAYLIRPFWLTKEAVRGLAVWARVERQVRASRDNPSDAGAATSNDEADQPAGRRQRTD